MPKLALVTSPGEFPAPPSWVGRSSLLFVLLLSAGPIIAATTELEQDLNRIGAVHVAGDSVIFMARGGSATYRHQDDRWRINLDRKYLGSYLTEEEYWEREVDQYFPKGSLRSTYGRVLLRDAGDAGELILAATAGEASVYNRHCVIDTLARAIYCFDLNRVAALDNDAESIWLGHPRGMMRIDRRSGERADFVVLPVMSEDSSILIDDNRIWSTCDGVGIQSIGIADGEITLWDSGDLMKDLLSPPKPPYGPPISEMLQGAIVFSNLLRDQSNIYVACYFVSAGNYLIPGSSCMLTYAKADSTWTATWLKLTEGRKPIDAISLIKMLDGELWAGKTMLWLGAGHVQFWEDEIEGIGGLYTYDPELYEPFPFGEVDRQQLVARMEPVDDGVAVETYWISSGRRRAYKILDRSRYVVTADSLGPGYKDYLAARALGKGPVGIAAVPDQLKHMRVIPRVVEIKRGQHKVDLRRY